MARLGGLAIGAGAIWLAAATNAQSDVAQTSAGRPDTGAPQSPAAGGDAGVAAMKLTESLQQAGEPARAVATFEAARVAEPPDFALLAATRAYRDLKRYDEAEKLAREGLRRFPDQTVWPLLLALVLADAGRPKEALDVLSGPEAQRAPRLELLLAEGFAWRRAGDPFRALSAYVDALKLAPANGEAKAASAELLRSQGGAYGAAALAGTTTPYAADEAAAMVRWGVDAQPSDPRRRFDGTDAAIARLDHLIGNLPPPPAEASARRRLRLDRMVALRDRVRMREVVTEAESLRAEAPLPPYAEEAYADALLYLRRPKDARAAYLRVLAANPKDVSDDLRLSARYGVFYASVEVEDFKTAYATIDAIVKDEPIWRTYHDGPARYANPDRAYAEVTAVNARSWGNELAIAWAKITGIARAAPANPSARLALAEIARARGWPRRANAEEKIAVSLSPDSLDSRIALVELAVAEGRYAEAKRMAADLLGLYPENTRVQRLVRDLGADLGWVFEFEAEPSGSEGGGTNAMNESLTLQARLTSPLIDDHWRLFTVSDFANANPPEGYVERTRISAGAQWSSPDAVATVYANHNLGNWTGSGAGATFDWLASDQLRMGVAGEIHTWDTPLRALLHGITANEVAARVTYTWDESHSLTGGFAFLPFSDGNRRISASTTYTQRLVSLPHFVLTGSAEVYYSHNDRPQAPYYNPNHDVTADVGLLAEQTIWRHYEVSLTQAISGNTGFYAEDRFAAEWIGTLRYEHRWRLDPWMAFAYGVELRRRVYDGEAENTVAVVVRLSRRF